MGEKLVLEVYKSAKVQTDAEIAVIIDGLKAQQAKLQEDLETASKIEADRERDLIDAEKALADAQATHNQAQQNLAASEAREKAVQAQVLGLTSHTREQAATITSQAERIGSLQAHLDAAEQRCRDFEKRIHELEGEGKN
jgi:chromosome segregation ATPase